ncbi:hypothetical protein LOAG_07742 [Loa loa]|uniref:Uncharacterized protein n=1 Tax=Loa loa TaxID=7209 RepID=A0A1S0TVX5_LOALO|nr:hypothetical protein LOAG_07742 [Loa loa]EFO20750.1 hypothetical protein LOAG_07742 [Loa loa]
MKGTMNDAVSHPHCKQMSPSTLGYPNEPCRSKTYPMFNYASSSFFLVRNELKRKSNTVLMAFPLKRRGVICNLGMSGSLAIYTLYVDEYDVASASGSALTTNLYYRTIEIANLT